MPSLGVLAVSVAIVAALIYRFILYPLYLSPLSGIPGPRLAAWTSMYTNYHWYRETAIQLTEKLHEQYGPIVRIGPSEVMTNDPEQLVPIFGARSTMIRVPELVIMDNHSVPNTFSSITNEEHRYRRKLITAVYSGQTLHSNQPMLAFLRDRIEKVNGMIDASLGKPLDLHLLSNRYAIDNVTFQVYGDSWDLLGGHHTHHARDITNTIVGAVPTWRMGFILNPLSVRPFRVLLPRFIKNMQNSQQALEATNSRSIEKVTNSGKSVGAPKETTLALLRHQAKSDPSVTEKHIASECLDNVVAGTDAPAAAATYLVHELAQPKNHKHQVRLQEELQTLARTDDGQLDFNEICSLPFLNSVCYESLRVYPPGPGSMQQRTTVEPTPLTVEGKTHTLPPGTMVGCGAFAMHRRRDIFGPDAGEFNPERWDEKDPTRLSKMRQAWIPFGSGTRACLGQPLAMLELKVFVASVLRGRTVRLPPSSSDQYDPEDMEVQYAVVLRPKNLRCMLVFDTWRNS